MAGDARRFTLLPRGGFTREYEYGSGPDKILVRDNDTGREFMVDPYGAHGTDTLPGGLRVLGIHRVEGARLVPGSGVSVPEEGRAVAMDGVVAASGLGASPGTLELVATRDLPGGHAVVFGHADGHIAYYPEDGKTKKFNPGEYEEMTSG